VVTITIGCEDTGTFVTGMLDIGEDNLEDSEEFTITSNNECKIYRERGAEKPL
jgi:hypothetical protein